jgi:predicted deacylase
MTEPYRVEWQRADSPRGRMRGRLSVPGLEPGLPVSRWDSGEDGPHLLITAGVHGGEYVGIEAARQFAATLDRTPLTRGTVTLVHLANPPAFYAKRQYVVPEDGKNLNRVFPGRPDGSLAERIAHGVMTLARGASHWIDLHSGDLHEALMPFVLYPADGPTREASRRMAEVYGISVLVESGAIEGGTYQAAAASGINAILPESGQMGQLEADAVARHHRGLESVCRLLGLLSGEPLELPIATYTRNTWTRSPRDGLHLPRLEVGQPVTAGQVGAVITDEYGDEVATVSVPHDGVVLFRASSLAICRDDPLFAVIAP